jgi:hypothetical protein
VCVLCHKLEPFTSRAQLGKKYSVRSQKQTKSFSSLLRLPHGTLFGTALLVTAKKVYSTNLLEM